MKKSILALIMIFAVAMITACSNSDNNGAQPKVGDITKTIFEQSEFPQMTEAKADHIKLMYDLDASDFEEYSIFQSADPVISDELAVVKAKSKEQAEEIKKAFDTRVSERYEVYKGYAPESAKKLQNASVEVKGNYVMLVVGDAPDKAVEVFKDSFKKS